MTAHELARQLLSGPDTQVIVQKDSEGNEFSPLAGCDPALYVAENTWSGTAYDDPAECSPDAAPCVVLFPVN